MPRGVRRQSSVVLTLIVCAVLSGAESFLGLGRWAASLPQRTLRRLGTQRSPNPTFGKTALKGPKLAFRNPQSLEDTGLNFENRKVVT